MASGLRKARDFIKLGDSAFHKGDYDKAVYSYSKALKLTGASAKNNEALIVIADASNGLGHTLRSKGQYSKSKEFNEKALSIYRKLYKSDKTLAKKLVLALHYTGDVLADLNHIDKALAISNEELGLARKLYAKDRKNLPYLVYGLNLTSARLANKKRFGAAIKLLGEALRIQKSAYGSNKEKSYPNLSWTYHLIGATMLESGKAKEAIPYLRMALQMRLVIANKNKRYVGALRNTLDALSLAYGQKNSTSARSQRGYL